MQNRTIYPSLAGKRVFITGGATGIGAALVRRFTQQQAKVTFADQNSEQGTDLVRELDDIPDFIHLDITDTQALQSTIGDANKGAPLAVLINNAANDMRQSPADVDEASWRACMAVNLDASFFAAQAAAPIMAEHGGGSIINFGSVGWMMASGGYPGYASAKSAVHGLTRSFARDLGKHAIRVNTLVPGWVMTQRQLDLWVDDAANALIDNNQDRLGKNLWTDSL